MLTRNFHLDSADMFSHEEAWLHMLIERENAANLAYANAYDAYDNRVPATVAAFNAASAALTIAENEKAVYMGKIGHLYA